MTTTAETAANRAAATATPTADNNPTTTKGASDVPVSTEAQSGATDSRQMKPLSPHLADLEAEAIEILREVAGQFELSLIHI